MYKKSFLYVKNMLKLCLFAFFGVLLLALRYILRTPQALESVLPGEARLYKWTYGQVYYHVFGPLNAQPLVLLHTPGVGASSYEMRSIIPGLAHHYRVYALDLLGFGLSDRPSIDYTFVTYITLLRDFLSHIVKQPATLLASNVSGGYAVAVAAQEPALCTGVILLSPLPTQPTTITHRVLALLAQLPIVDIALYSLLTLPFVMSVLITEQRRPQERDLEYYLAVSQQLNAHRAVLAYIAGKLNNASALTQLDALTQPVLEVWGTRTLHDAQVASFGRNPTAQVQLVLLRDAGTYIQEQQPELVIKHVLEWQDSRKEAPALAAVEAKTDPVEGNKTTDTVVIAEQHPVVHASPALPAESQARLEQQQRQAQDVSGQTVVEAYCVKCKQKRRILNPQRTVTKNGRNALEGTCPVCGTRLFRFVANQ